MGKHPLWAAVGVFSVIHLKKADFETLTYVRYLNTVDAPDNLRIGFKLELLEGAKKVAFGKIIEESDFNF